MDDRVLIIGAGPVGSITALALLQAGIPVTILESLAETPTAHRAATTHSSTLDALETVGIADEVVRQGLVARYFQYRHRETNEIFAEFDFERLKGETNHPFAVQLEQHKTIAIALARNAAFADFALHREHTAVELTQDGSGVSLVTETPDGARHDWHGRYLIGCDGASSTVRRALDIKHEDLDFDEPWLVVDVGVNDRGAAKLPKTSAQFCEPSRPTTFLIGVGAHRRWEIMLMPGETPQQFETDAAVWQLLSRWLAPEDGTLWRRASYRFHALVARQWRRGRVFLAGDAAHQQPPFLGQGMCQGIRDVANLAWKLTAVLQGRANDALLDTYGVERASHVKRLTTTIKHIGHTICERDEARARKRDADLLAQADGVVKSVPRQDLIPPLDSGLLSPLPHLANGTLFPQPRVQHQGKSALLDDVAGAGARLMLAAGFAARRITCHAVLEQCSAGVVPFGPDGFEEEDGVVAAWFAQHGVSAALVRPDHYVYGVAATPEQVQTLAASYHAACTA